MHVDKDQRGQSLLEFALIAPFLLFFLLALVNFAIAVDRKIVLDHAVREGVRYASVGGQALNSGTIASAQDVKSYTAAQSQGIVSAGAVTVTNEDCNAAGELGDNVRVNAQYPYSFMTGVSDLFGAGLFTVTLNASATARVEHGLSGSVDTISCPP